MPPPSAARNSVRLIAAVSMLLRRAAWAPVAVLVFHALIAKTRFRTPLDFTVHCSGGAAAAYFFFEALGCLEAFVGKLTSTGRYVFSFSLACTAGLFWEFGELLSDIVFKSHIQFSLNETMSDLLADTGGALFSLFLVCVVRWLRRARVRSIGP